jgi:hypothetical protein
MRKWKLVSLVVMFAFAVCLVTTAFAAGNKNDLAYLRTDELLSDSDVDNTDGVIVTKDGVPYQGVTISAILGYRDLYVHNTTDMTVVALSNTGRTYIVKQNTKFQLPEATDGVTYTFATGADVEIEIQVSTTPDTIVLSFDGSNGNGVIETSGTNTTGMTVTLASDGTNWYVTSQSDAIHWTDGGAWAQLDMGAQE